jgi:rubrerythrin
MDDSRVKVAAPGEDSAVRNLAGDPSSRKRFLKMVGGTGAVGAFGILLAACGDDDEGETTAATDTTGAASKDLDILNYALTLEFLEADFYRQVIDSGEIRDQEIASLAEAFGENEQEHVDALTAAVEQMGGVPATAPQTKFDDVIAGGETEILSTAAMIENIGAAAYLGAAPEIQTPEVLAAALSIHTVEARHAAALNDAAGNDFTSGEEFVGSIPDGAFAKPATMDEVLKLVEPFVASSGGGNDGGN